jgi:hypothetical protein
VRERKKYPKLALRIQNVMFKFGVENTIGKDWGKRHVWWDDTVPSKSSYSDNCKLFTNLAFMIASS